MKILPALVACLFLASAHSSDAIDYVVPLNPGDTIADHGRLIAGAVFTDYRVLPYGKDIQLTFASISPQWTTRGNIRAILSYPFVQLQCTRLTVITGRKNKRARKLTEGLGFRLEGVIRKYYDGHQDGIVYGMLRDECIWLDQMVVDKPAELKVI